MEKQLKNEHTHIQTYVCVIRVEVYGCPERSKNMRHIQKCGIQQEQQQETATRIIITTTREPENFNALGQHTQLIWRARPQFT